MDWTAFLSDGLDSVIDGVVEVKTAEANASTPEQIIPATPASSTSAAAVNGTFSQNGIVLGATTYTWSTIGVGVAGLLGLAYVAKKVF